MQRTSTIQKVENLKDKIFGIERSLFQNFQKILSLRLGMLT
mgnify:CR=1 FL=1